MNKEVSVRIATRYRVIQVGFIFTAFILLVSVFFFNMDELNNLTQSQLNITFLSLGLSFVLAIVGIVYGTSNTITFKEDGIQRNTLFGNTFKPYSEFERIIFIRTMGESFKNAMIKKNDLLINKTFTNVEAAIEFLKDKDVEVIS